jgi:NCS1 family nucleobase:cation symporter-1
MAAERTWNLWHIASLWVGMGVCIPSYMLASSMIGAGLSWRSSLFAIFLGNAIVLVPLVINAHAGTKYGIPFPVFARAAFGVRGTHVPSLLRAVVACGWFGIQTWIGGLALHTLLTAAWAPWAGVPGGLGIAFVIFWLVQVAIIVRGLEGIRRLESWTAPLLLTGAAALLIWAISVAGGLGQILTGSARLQQADRTFWALFPAALTANVG